ncbi:hypothetical protein IF2G_03181 [Cordyceps javanica]|nr:hypothetical protein IF2G_03181 [Cordyceps javanica]
MTGEKGEQKEICLRPKIRRIVPRPCNVLSSDSHSRQVNRIPRRAAALRKAIRAARSGYTSTESATDPSAQNISAMMATRNFDSLLKGSTANSCRQSAEQSRATAATAHSSRSRGTLQRKEAGSIEVGKTPQPTNPKAHEPRQRHQPYREPPLAGTPPHPTPPQQTQIASSAAEDVDPCLLEPRMICRMENMQ